MWPRAQAWHTSEGVAAVLVLEQCCRVHGGTSSLACHCIHPCKAAGASAHVNRSIRTEPINRVKLQIQLERSGKRHLCVVRHWIRSNPAILFRCTSMAPSLLFSRMRESCFRKVALHYRTCISHTLPDTLTARTFRHLGERHDFLFEQRCL